MWRVEVVGGRLVRILKGDPAIWSYPKHDQFRSTELREQKKMGIHKISQLVFRVLPGWCDFSENGHALLKLLIHWSTSQLQSTKKLGKDMGRHGKSSKFHRGGNFSLCGKIDSQRMEIRRLSRIVEDWNLGYLEFAFSVSNIFSQNGGERWWGKHGKIRKQIINWNKSQAHVTRVFIELSNDS